MAAHLEVERAFSPDGETPLPELAGPEGVPGVARTEAAGTSDLDATYYDTVDLALFAAGVTLRRRAGGVDEGWHLKLPVRTPGARLEVHEPLGPTSGEPPPALLDLVDGWTRGTALAPVARIRTRRTTVRLVGAGGRVLAELADDRVEGRAARLGAELVRWREWEVELVEGEPELLDAVEELLGRLGVGRSPVQRKLAVVLGDPPRGARRHPTPSKKGPARDALEVYLAEQVRVLATQDPVVRLHGAEGVHELRKACRRLRGALATFRPLVDREVTDPVRDELRWLARSLGEVRDAEVVTDRIAELVAEQDPELVVGPVPDRVRDRRDRVLERHRQAVGEVLGSDRYRALRQLLDRLVEAPPWTPVAEEPAREVLRRRVRKEGRRLHRVQRRSESPHEVRRAAKRLRYAYEVVAPVWPTRAAAPRDAAHELTEVLGDRQDQVVAMAALVELAEQAASAGESSFTYGRLHAQAERRAADLLDRAARVWREVDSARW